MTEKEVNYGQDRKLNKTNEQVLFGKCNKNGG